MAVEPDEHVVITVTLVFTVHPVVSFRASSEHGEPEVSVIREFGKWVLPVGWTVQLRELRTLVRPNKFDIERRERRAFMQKAFGALSFNEVSGDYVEFGCWGGVTFSLAYQEIQRAGRPRKLWAFDSFQGLPQKSGPEDEHPVWNAGALAMSLDEFHRVCKNAGVPRDAYEVIPGFYEDTLFGNRAAMRRLPNDVALPYIDCDMYSSTSAVLRYLAPVTKNGMIVAFDDYYCVSQTALSGERRALLEFTRARTQFHFLPYVQYGWHGMSFVLEERRRLPDTWEVLN